ncbi:hypothetical protein Sipo8835_31985 [Streptomyces ipomoeae]|uniref:Uncharacterized protein n=2 Tax=Streptomyces ipomoeae TaxID=103232 RepID=L1L024_9ACTN|nr:hypothetical protein [Streptomyces ipomoeae]EKX66080.1 hypothetical protein STRIP9103_04462 [Streptomyces ipomoeae 91-03]MDX2696443.1 hypothetical protein [Streptomyces ipomoeae]MDX2824937.1 hypothetical protein [Streptomyces ipomoeae]MDX2842215.1 hypothetical protein [Streptomyces ipomoeae]MDX2877133.1 hypothetical protein [Streptomyces ipomoeae]
MTYPPESDEALLRRAFALIGEEAGRPEPDAPLHRHGPDASPRRDADTSVTPRAEAQAQDPAQDGAGPVRVGAPNPPARMVWWRRRGVVLAGLASAAALCAGVLGSTLLDGGATNTESGGSHDSDGRANASGQGQTLLEWIACGRTIAEGDVVAVRPSSEAGRVVVTFDVQDWIKPARGAERITLDVVDPTEARVREPWEKGQHLLIVVPERRDQETDTFQGEQLQWYRAKIEQGLPDAATTECPPAWSDTRGEG